MSIFDLADNYRKIRLNEESEKQQRDAALLLEEEKNNQCLEDGAESAYKALRELDGLQTGCGNAYTLTQKGSSVIMEVKQTSVSSSLPGELMKVVCVGKNHNDYSYRLHSKMPSSNECVSYIRDVTSKNLRATVADQVISHLDVTDWVKRKTEANLSESRSREVDYEEQG